MHTLCIPRTYGVHTRRVLVALFSAVFLSGCAPFPKPSQSFRDQSVQIASSTRFDEERFQGTWFVIANFDANPLTTEFPRISSTWEFEERHGPEIGIAKCCQVPNPPQSYVETGVGRFRPDTYLLRDQPPVWVLWVDEGHETAVLGTPDGSFGAILNKTLELRQDRFQAAREILDFNGYDISQLRVQK